MIIQDRLGIREESSVFTGAARWSMLPVFFSVIVLIFIGSVMSSCETMKTTSVSKPDRKERVVKAPKLTKRELYIKANVWMVETFNDAESVIEFRDEESGVIAGKYLMKWIRGNSHAESQRVFAIIKIYVKEGAAKVVIEPSSYLNTNISGMGYSLVEANYAVDRLISSFTKAIQEKEDDF